MFNKILVTYNGTPDSRSALYECIQLHPPASTEVHLLAVIELSAHGMAGGYCPEVAFANRTQVIKEELEAGKALMVAAGLRVATHLQTGEPIDVIGSMAEALKVDLVIVGHSRRKAFSARWWRGSTDALLVERVKCNVLVAVQSAL
ncbi:universal stress protein [Glaciimonas sp. Gout2]|uniref:universal stress protein n=1 Tax=unclassified Glaciimonas TaxID=2644401 RepID=UPI002AB3BB1C|nr:MULTISPECIES: universal stress protein [unclassified Glaciimonas]MDY7548558.1 universal stress protein [Glaciimonas sp. CA11.2]MEB0013745.1 universal stress protein [Glaciimonas sp. Cout2]MEB0083350.1 universal stress protein [Glaciimonas sp. Gout2]